MDIIVSFEVENVGRVSCKRTTGNVFNFTMAKRKYKRKSPRYRVTRLFIDADNRVETMMEWTGVAG